MAASHLTPEQLAAARDGDLDAPEAISHLESCLDCQARLREARFLRILLARPESTATPHPDPEELAAYLDGRLSRRRLGRVEGHLAACAQCFADLEGIGSQVSGLTPAEETPPAWVVERAIRSLRPPTPLNLGTLIVEWLDRLRLRLVPPIEQTRLAGPQYLFDLPRTAPSFLARSSMMSAAEEVGGGRPEVSAPSPAPSQRLAPTPVIVHAGLLTLRIAVEERPTGITLTLHLTSTTDGSPVPGVELTLQREGASSEVATTDPGGLTELSLAEGRSTLSIRHPVQATLVIEC